ncbi:hypothetical protein IAU59_007423 [Kwoniella sp. CBS 9459]
MSRPEQDPDAIETIPLRPVNRSTAHKSSRPSSAFTGPSIGLPSSATGTSTVQGSSQSAGVSVARVPDNSDVSDWPPEVIQQWIKQCRRTMSKAEECLADSELPAEERSQWEEAVSRYKTELEEWTQRLEKSNAGRSETSKLCGLC